MNTDALLEQVRNAILRDAQENRQQGPVDPTALIQEIERLFARHQANSSQPQGMDPYGGLPDESGYSVTPGVGPAEGAD